MPRSIHALVTAVAATALAPSLAQADALGDLSGSFREALDSGGMLSALGLILLAGLATALTPCVYPMIAITVSVFGARKSRTLREGALLSTVFVLGIALLFTPLGIIAALTGGYVGAALTHPAVVLGLAALFGAMALSMFGGFDLVMPPRLQNWLAEKGGSGYGGALALGAVSGLIAAPCVGPVITALLAWVGTTKNVGFGALALFVYALGLGSLFWIVGTFAVSLPKPGRWMETIKSVFGVIMLTVTFWFIRDLLPYWAPAERNTVWLGASTSLLVLGIALGALHLSFHQSTRSVQARKLVGIVLAVAGAAGLAGWAGGLPPGAKIAWRDDYDQAKSFALRASKPLFVDFDASWCGACGELDRNTFSDPRVVAAAQRFVSIRVDLSPELATPRKEAILASYSGKGLPLVVLHDASGREVTRLEQFVEPEEMLALLARVE